MSTFANSEEPDEMQHNVVCKGKKYLQTKDYSIF